MRKNNRFAHAQKNKWQTTKKVLTFNATSESQEEVLRLARYFDIFITNLA